MIPDNNSGDNAGMQDDFDPASISAESFEDDDVDNDADSADNTLEDDSDEDVADDSDSADNDTEDDDEGENTEEDESESEDDDETSDEDDEDADNSDPESALNAEIAALLSTDGIKLDAKTKKVVSAWLQKKGVGIQKVVDQAKAAYNNVSGLVNNLKKSEDPNYARPVALEIVGAIAKHHGITVGELLGIQAGEAQASTDADEDVDEDELRYLSMSDADDRKKIAAHFQKPVLAKFSALEQRIAQMETAEAERQADQQVRAQSGKLIREIEKTMNGWKPTARMVSEARAKLPQIFESNPKEAVKMANADAYAQHMAQATKRRAKPAKNGSIPKGGPATVAAKWDEDDPGSFSASNFE